MALDDKFMQQLMATFRTELEEHVQAMNAALLALEQGPDPDDRAKLLEEVFREAHSLKGAARAVDLSEIEGLSHRLESVFSAARRGELTLSPALCDVLYETLDAIKTLMEHTLQGEEANLDVGELHTRLEAASKGAVLRLSKDRPVQGPKPQVPHPHPEVPGQAAAIAAQELEAKKTDGPSQTPAHQPAAVSGNAPSQSREPAPSTSSEHALSLSKGQALSPSKGRPSAIVSEETIRVATHKLDALMAQMGELLVTQMRVEQRLAEIKDMRRHVSTWQKDWHQVKSDFRRLSRQNGHGPYSPLLEFLEKNAESLATLQVRLNSLHRQFSRDIARLSSVTDTLRDDVMQVRMLPVSTIFDAFHRMVRDLARERDKQVRLEIQGADTEVDKRMLEAMKAPIMHLLRNAIDHGIETCSERRRLGKPPQGTIILEARQEGGQVLVSVSDDGAGIDADRIRETALRRNVVPPTELEAMSDREVLSLIFRSGFSTNAIITDVSGRGVGLDVVRENVERLHGLINLETAKGHGTRFTLKLPLTLTTMQGLLVGTRDQVFAIPLAAVERILEIDPADIGTVETMDAITVEGRPLSLVRLDDLLELPRSEPVLSTAEGTELVAGQKVPAIIVGAAERRLALLVDSLVGVEEVVVKNLGKQLSRVRNVAGATILGTGQVVIILNVADLIKSARLGQRRTALPGHVKTREEVVRQRILVVDDSITTRTLEKNILESAGYDVIVAVDGLEAMDLLESEGCDLIVTDVNMPRMDGFELTARIRQEEKFHDLPVILVTSLDSAADKARGIDVGADAYITKSTFNQDNLLETIRQLI